MAKEWCLWLGERSELTGRLVCDGAGRSRTEQDGAGRSRTEQDGTLAFAANARLRRVVSIIALIAFVLLPKRPLYHIPGNRQAHESAAPCGRARRRAHPPCRPPRRRGSAAAGRAGRAARCRPCSGSPPPRHDRELLPAITMRVRLRARRAVRSTAPECPALPSPRRAVATRLQPSPIEPGAHAQHYAFDIRPVPRAIRKCFESYQILRRAGIQKGLGQELVEGRSFDYPLLERSAPRRCQSGCRARIGAGAPACGERIPQRPQCVRDTRDRAVRYTPSPGRSR